MPNWLFENFLDDAAEYQSAQRYWETLFRRALPRDYLDDQLKLYFLNNPDRDGNPIFTAFCRPLELAVRILQQPVAEPDEVDLDYWMDSVSIRPNGPKVRELVISCSPSKENELEITVLLRNWFAKGKIETLDRFENDRVRFVRPFSFSPELCIG